MLEHFLRGLQYKLREKTQMHEAKTMVEAEAFAQRRELETPYSAPWHRSVDPHGLHNLQHSFRQLQLGPTPQRGRQRRRPPRRNPPTTQSRGRYQPPQNRARNPPPARWANDGAPICYNCGRKGHIAQNCWQASRSTNNNHQRTRGSGKPWQPRNQWAPTNKESEVRKQKERQVDKPWRPLNTTPKQQGRLHALLEDQDAPITEAAMASYIDPGVNEPTGPIGKQLLSMAGSSLLTSPMTIAMVIAMLFALFTGAEATVVQNHSTMATKWIFVRDNDTLPQKQPYVTIREINHTVFSDPAETEKWLKKHPDISQALQPVDTHLLEERNQVRKEVGGA